MTATTGFAPATVGALTADQLAGQLSGVSPQSAGASEDLVLLPAGFVGDILGGFAGAIGGGIGKLAGNEKIGKDIGDAASPFLKMLPWSVVPANVVPQGAGPGTPPQGPSEDLLFVPAGVVGNLLSGLSGVIGSGVGGIFGKKELGAQIGKTVAPIFKFLPWSVIPAEEIVSAQSAAPNGATTPAATEDLMFVPAGIFGNIASGFAGLIGQGVGALAGNQKLGKQIGDAASPFLKMLPWSVVPAGVTPQSVVPGEVPVQGPDEDLMLVPAGIFGSLLGGFGGSLAGGAIGKWLGNEKLGKQIGSTVGGIGGGFLPFTMVPAPPTE